MLEVKSRLAFLIIKYRTSRIPNKMAQRNYVIPDC